ncbi:MAG TPA: hypothetical protein VMT55_00085 [Candidatus Sulfotelmatobacter sp.]|nr:hypothetical protein [Candidatus Sulfotelmatobacter sp.]
MNPMPLRNGKDTPLNQRAGALPQVDQAILNWLQPMTFILVDKYVSGGFLIESGNEQEAWTAPDGRIVVGKTIDFQGFIVFRERPLEMKKEGQRRWSNAEVLAFPQLQLKDDDCVIYGPTNTQYRVLNKNPQALFGLVKYYLKEDFKFAGPLQQLVQGDQPMDDGQGNVVIM